MKRASMGWAVAVLALVVLAACSGGGADSPTPTPPPSDEALAEAIASAAADPANDTSTNASASFTVLQVAGLPAVTVDGKVTVHFTVFSGGAVKAGLTLADMSFAIARLIPASGGNPAAWTNYVSLKATAAAGVGPGGATAPPASAWQATTDPRVSEAQLAYNSAGYYTYTFTADITDPAWAAAIKGVDYSTNGVQFVPAATHRVAIQLSYADATGAIVRVNPYFDFTFAGAGPFASTPLTDPAAQDFQMSEVSSCNVCHEKLSAHGGGRVAIQYCDMCHNPGTSDPNSGNVLTLSTMVHKIHAGQLLASVPGGEKYTIWGYADTEHDFSSVGFPQDMRNCAGCHSASNPATPQGDNWKTAVSKQACLTCHANGTGSPWYGTHLGFANAIIGPGADPNNLTNRQCLSCHAAGKSVSSGVVHWPQTQVNQALYKMNIDGVEFVDPPDHKGRSVKLKYSLTNPTDGNKPYRLLVNAVDCTPKPDGSLDNCGDALYGNLKAYLAYQNMVGQWPLVTDFSAYNNGGNVAFACLYEGPKTATCPSTAVNDGSNHYTATIPLPDDTPTAVAFGTAMVVTAGQIKELKLRTDWSGPDRPPVDPPVRVNTAAQHASTQLALSGALQPRRVVVSDDKCNACHAVLGTASGSNTMANAFHAGARNTWQACIVCHDPNRASSTVMTAGLQLNEAYEFNRLIHGIHGNAMRYFPFTNGNKVVGAFCNPANPDPAAQAACDPALTLAPDVKNFAAKVRWPGVGLNCNACHVDNSFLGDPGKLGSAVLKYGATEDGPVVFGGSVLVTDVWNWNVISPMAASCTSCHDSPAAQAHVVAAGNASFGTLAQGRWPQETCADCHAVGLFMGVDRVHGPR
jgi:OmcA/MtrC family decaheme c-type cytochrome